MKQRAVGPLGASSKLLEVHVVEGDVPGLEHWVEFHGARYPCEFRTSMDLVMKFMQGKIGFSGLVLGRVARVVRAPPFVNTCWLEVHELPSSEREAFEEERPARCFACEQLAERVAVLESRAVGPDRDTIWLVPRSKAVKAELEITKTEPAETLESLAAGPGRDTVATARADQIADRPFRAERRALEVGRDDALAKLEATKAELERARADFLASDKRREELAAALIDKVEAERERAGLASAREAALKAVKAEFEATKNELAEANRKLAMVHQGPGEVWRWQGGGDDLGGLSCPVVMEAATLEALIAKSGSRAGVSAEPSVPRVFACGVVEDGVWSVGDVVGVEAPGRWIVRFQKRGGEARVSVPIEKLIETYSPDEDDEPQFSDGPIEVGTRVVMGRDGDYHMSGVVTDDYGMNTAGVLWDDGVFTREIRFDLGRLGPRTPSVSAEPPVPRRVAEPTERLVISRSDERCGAVASDGSRCARQKGHRRGLGHAAVVDRGLLLRWGASDWSDCDWFVSLSPLVSPRTE